MIAKKVDGKWVVGNMKKVFPNVSFSGVPDTAWLSANDCHEVVENIDHDPKSHKQVPINPVVKDGKVYVTEIQEKTDAEKTAHTERVAMMLRQQRNTLLSASDWTQMPDFTHAKKDEWKTYRQKLRDISKESNFPYVELPSEPT